MPTPAPASPTVRLATESIVLGVVVLALKAGAWSVTGSAALFSDAAETLVNVAAAAMALYALQVSERPADANHPYGHAKAEFFSAVVEGALIVVAARGHPARAPGSPGRRRRKWRLRRSAWG